LQKHGISHEQAAVKIKIYNHIYTLQIHHTVLSKLQKERNRYSVTDIHVDRNGMANLPWMLLITTMCPDPRLIMSGSNAVKQESSIDLPVLDLFKVNLTSKIISTINQNLQGNATFTNLEIILAHIIKKCIRLWLSF